MAAETQRAPRMVRGVTSMAAAAAVARGQCDLVPDTDMISAWAAVLQAAGGIMLVDPLGRQAVSHPIEFAPFSEAIGGTVFSLVSAEERAGAIKALRAVLDLCGRATRDEVFSFAAIVMAEA